MPERRHAGVPLSPTIYHFLPQYTQYAGNMQGAIPLFWSKIGKLTKLQGANSVPEDLFCVLRRQKMEKQKNRRMVFCGWISENQNQALGRFITMR
jgi:hypothetical protein